MRSCDETLLAVGVDTLLRDFMCVGAGEEVLITADAESDRDAVAALFRAASVLRAKPAVFTVPRLPFQGALSDP
jgi:hypothetical protein